MAPMAEYSPTEWPQKRASSWKHPDSRSSATWAMASTAMATWVNCVRKSTPCSWRCISRPTRISTGLSRTTVSSEKPRRSRQNASASSQTLRAAAERA
jgi:hypothetical protein